MKLNRIVRNQFVSRDLKFVAVGVAKIDRVANLVILEMEFDAAPFEFFLCGKKVFAIGTKG